MKNHPVNWLSFWLLPLFILSLFISATAWAERPDFVLVIHGGAGNIDPESLGEADQNAYIMALEEALQTGRKILEAGGNALDAVEATVRVLEDNPLFNAGKGAVFTSQGTNELDASIMCGKSLNAGAVAGIGTIKNPISAARKVMEHSPHVLLSGKGAEQFAFEQGLEVVDPSYFFEQRRWDQYRQFIRARSGRGWLHEDIELQNEIKMGTVGAVALDMQGNLAAATSTGGMTGKEYGRIGDSPLIGAGTYADNASLAVSSTGHGEYFIRHVLAYDLAARMRYGNQSLEEAARAGVLDVLGSQGVNGGVIALDHLGNVSMPFTTTAMFRGMTASDGRHLTAIFAH